MAGQEVHGFDYVSREQCDDFVGQRAESESHHTPVRLWKEPSRIVGSAATRCASIIKRIRGLESRTKLGPYEIQTPSARAAARRAAAAHSHHFSPDCVAFAIVAPGLGRIVNARSFG